MIEMNCYTTNVDGSWNRIDKEIVGVCGVQQGGEVGFVWEGSEGGW